MKHLMLISNSQAGGEIIQVKDFYRDDEGKSMHFVKFVSLITGAKW